MLLQELITCSIVLASLITIKISILLRNVLSIIHDFEGENRRVLSYFSLGIVDSY